MNNTIDTSNIIKTVISDTKKTVNDDTQNTRSTQTDSLSSGNLADTISITDAAKQLASVEKLDTSNMPINDSNKLDAIKQDIANGTYQIDSKAIADKLIEFE